jgi:hypothetical protein
MIRQGGCPSSDEIQEIPFMRKISYLVLAAAFAFAVTGCGEEKKAAAPAKTDAKAGDAKK